jgi:hypothetical protein
VLYIALDVWVLCYLEDHSEGLPLAHGGLGPRQKGAAGMQVIRKLEKQLF